MSMYGSGLTFGQIANMEKERIKHALEGEKCAGEDENGFIWVPCSNEDADAEILAIFDNCVYQALDAMHSSRALEKIAIQHGYQNNQAEYMKALKETETTSEYVYEGEQEDIPDSEIEEL